MSIYTAEKNLPKLSIITVVYNAKDLIERTIKSVLEQTYPNIEYIIIDGNSSESTVEIIKRYNDYIDQWISEPDRGLYDAMNKGLALARGDYVIFLNAGDTFYSAHTIQKCFDFWEPHTDILYGETLIVDVTGKPIGERRLKAPEQLSWKSFRDGMMVCHQSVIVRRSLAKNYNLLFKIAADFEWVLLALKEAKSIVNTHQYIACFLDGGLNKQKIPLALKERFFIMCRHYGFFSTLFRHFIIGIRFFLYWIKEKRF